MKKKELKAALVAAQDRHSRLDAYAHEQTVRARNAERELAELRNGDVRVYLNNYADFLNAWGILLLGRNIPAAGFPVSGETR